MMSVNVDYSRIDGPLAQACHDVRADERSLNVFVHTFAPPDDAQSRKLGEAGIAVTTPTRKIFTATLSPSQVAALSREPWVKQLRLSQPLKMA